MELSESCLSFLAFIATSPDGRSRSDLEACYGEAYRQHLNLLLENKLIATSDYAPADNDPTSGLDFKHGAATSWVVTDAGMNEVELFERKRKDRAE